MSVLQEIKLGKYFSSQLRPSLVLSMSQALKLARLALNFLYEWLSSGRKARLSLH